MTTSQQSPKATRNAPISPSHADPRNRLPIQHPDYRYPTTKNPYGEKVRLLADRIIVDNDTEAARGEWRSRFPDASRWKGKGRRKLHVELGCNGGHVSLEWAARSPQDAFIGLDWKFKQVFFGAEKSKKRDIDNLMFFRANLERLQYMFAPGEIDFLYLYFPDPWAKKSQLKNRWVTAEHLRQARKLVADGGVFHIKTDHPGYFDWMCEAIDQVKNCWKAERLTRDLHAGNPDAGKLKIPEVTIFEGVFIREGLPIHSVHLKAT